MTSPKRILATAGGKPVLLGISKRGDVYLRTLLIHDARAVISHFERSGDQAESWLKRLLRRRNRNISAAALANKNARIVWALLAPMTGNMAWMIKATKLKPFSS